MDPVPLAGIAAFLSLSALFSGYETAFFSLSPGQLSTLYLQYKGRPWIHWIRYFSDYPETLLSVILIGNTLANLGITLLLFYLGGEMGLAYGETLSALVALGLIVLMGEIFPKSIALTRPMIFLRLGTPIVQLLFWLSYPLGRALDALRKRIERRWRPEASPERLTQLVEMLPSELSPPTEKRVLKNLLLLRQLPVKAFMISRMDMKAIPISLGWKELKEALAQIPYIRVPVYRDTLDEVKGILMVKDLLPHWEKEEVTNWQALIRPAYFVPEMKNAYELLLELKSRRQHVAIVVDEFGAVAGLISLQRLLEAVFGYGEEEEGSTEALYEIQSDGSVCLQAQAPLVLVQEVLGLPADFFSEEEARTSENLAEFLLSLAERIPNQGEVLFYRDYAFEVVASSPHRIERVRAYRSVSRDGDTPSSDVSSNGAA
ncbi:MAG: hemolysin family protein [Bacteroidia bacterium]|nr:hemolysin family protein [Bacteroidia bacterium]